MCGIFGVCALPGAGVEVHTLKTLVDKLFILSESRGKEAAGLAVRGGDRLGVYKRPLAAREMIKEKAYARFFADFFPSDSTPPTLPTAIIGHSRLTTNGLQYISENNQPVIYDGLVAVHNGIIANEAELWQNIPNQQRQSDVDTEVFLALWRQFQREKENEVDAVRSSFAEVEGTVSVAALDAGNEMLLLATNCGSLYCCIDQSNALLVFASERFILKSLCEYSPLKKLLADARIFPVRSDQAYWVQLRTLQMMPFELVCSTSFSVGSDESSARIEVVDYSQQEKRQRDSMRRCMRCVLPSTFPFIRFDEEGVCNFCRDYKPMVVEPQHVLEERLAPYRRKDGEPDCMVMLSGGRDSSYGLYYIKEVLGMTPIAYTYDWGVITDLARRNAARMCGKLGVEHVIVSADISRKRRYVRQNIQAWLRRPDLGMIPLFMAGDKQYYYYANRLREQTGLDLTFVCECPLELTKFKAGFCGVNEGDKRLFDISLLQKTQLFSYYVRQYVVNPAYINGSFFDSMFALFSSYMMKHDYTFLFGYHRWDEDLISSTLVDEFGWELASDTRSTWRIGDGTAPFYNYIYHNVAGFTENETLRSNQIREGVLEREKALRLIEEENKPRWDSIEWYARTIGFDLDQALSTIHSMPKLYAS